MREEIHTYFVSCHAAVSMTVQRPDWTRLEKRPDTIGSFLIRDIDLNRMPSTLYTKLSKQEVRQLKRRVHSVETRIRNKTKFAEHLQNVKDLENETVAYPEWQLGTSVKWPKMAGSIHYRSSEINSGKRTERKLY